MTKKIRQNYQTLDEFSDLPRTFQHIRPIYVFIIGATFIGSIPTAIFWFLVIVYLIYRFVSEKNVKIPNENYDSTIPENSKSMAELIINSNGIKLLEKMARLFGPKNSTSKRTEINTVRPPLKHNLISYGQTISSKLMPSKLKWPFGRPRSLTSLRTLSCSLPDINANYTRHDSNESLDCLPDEHQATCFGSLSRSISKLNLMHRSTISVKSFKENKKQPYKNVVNVVLIRGKNIQLNTKSDYFLRFKLGKLKCKSKVSLIL